MNENYSISTTNGELESEIVHIQDKEQADLYKYSQTLDSTMDDNFPVISSAEMV